MARSPSPTFAPALRQAPPTGLFAAPSLGTVSVVSGFGFRGWRAFTIAAAAAAVLAVAFIAWTALRIGGDQATVAVDDIGEAVAALIAALSCGLAAARTSKRTRVAWAFFAASAASWGIGEVVWSVYEVGMGVNVPFPSAADVGFLLAIPLAVAGVFAFTSAPGRLATRGEAILAGAIIALSLLFVAWALGLGMVYDTSTASPPARLIGLAYPVGDIVTITVLVLALRRARRSELGSLFLLLGGLGAAALADSAFAYLTASGAYYANGSLLDAGWVVGYLMIALAPIWPVTDSEHVRAEGPIELWQLALPWAAVVAAAVTAIKLVFEDKVLDRFETVLAGCIGLLLVGSQVLSHRDSLSLLVNSRRTENQLQRRNALLDEIVSHAPLGIVRVGPGHANHRRQSEDGCPDAGGREPDDRETGGGVPGAERVHSGLRALPTAVERRLSTRSSRTAVPFAGTAAAPGFTGAQLRYATRRGGWSISSRCTRTRMRSTPPTKRPPRTSPASSA